MSFFTPAPPNPVTTEPSTFRTRAINLFAWITGTMLSEMETLNTNVTNAAAALNLNSINDTSVTSNTIGTGSKSFTVSASKSYAAGMWLSIADTAAPNTNSIISQVTSYSGTALVVNVPSNGIRGSGTKTAWVITLTAAPSTDIASTFIPVSSAVTLAASRTALDVPSTGDIGLKSIDYTLSAGALTLKLNPTSISFRSTTLTSGAPVTVSNAAQLTTVISSGSTAGAVSAVQSDIVLLTINNAGTMELAWTNLAGGLDLSEQGVITTVAEGGAGAADSATVIYSATARTGVAYKVVGLFRSTQTTAGTWAQTPTLVQGVGGQALAAMASFGIGQTLQDFTGSRSNGVTYYNTTAKPIFVIVHMASTSATSGAINILHTINGLAGITQYVFSNAVGYGISDVFVVPPGHSYRINIGGVPTVSLDSWQELR